MAFWHYAVAGAAAIGGAVLYRLSKAAPAPGPSQNACDKLEAAGAPSQAVDACRAALAFDKLLDAAFPDAAKKNAEINGPAVEVVAVEALAGVSTVTDSYGMTSIRMGPFGNVTAFPVKFTNGCVPIPGHPDRGKCGAGTMDIPNDAYFRVTSGDGKSIGGLLSGDPARDVLTFKWTAAHKAAAEDTLKRTVNFPLQVPSGAEAWFVRGQPIVCAAGTTVNRGRDHRTTPGPICAAPAAVVPPPPQQTYDGGTGRGTRSETCVGPTYIWDLSNGGFCRRRLAGELGETTGSGTSSAPNTTFRSDPPR